MDLRAKIKELVSIMEETGANEVEVSSWWGRKIRVAKGLSGGPASSHAAPAPAARTSATSGAPAIEPGSEELAGHAIRSPIVGTFYRASSPESDAFINVGDSIKTGQTICIIEAMKIMNEIESDIDGVVLDILPNNAGPVEFNQPLVIVGPG